MGGYSEVEAICLLSFTACDRSLQLNERVFDRENRERRERETASSRVLPLFPDFLRALRGL